jgi:DNA-binding response OmpR family regulator
MLGDLTGSRGGYAIVNRVLIVDEDADAASATKALLQGRGCDVDIAKDGGQAQSMFVMRRPDFVLLDVILPNETGYEVCERFKTTDPNVPVMFLTAVDLDDSVKLAKRVGADDYLIKPYHPDELIARIQAAADVVWQKSRGETSGATVGADGRIHFACKCGKRLKVAEQHRGRSLTCPECGEIVTVPRG